MHMLARKSKAHRQTVSIGPAQAGRANAVRSPATGSIVHLQRTMGNQAVQGLLQTRPMKRETGSAHVPGVQRVVEVRPPGRGEASAFDRRQELIDRMNGLTSGMEYSLDGRVIRYNVIDEAALTSFDRQMQGFIDRAELVPMRLITGEGYVGGGPLTVDSLQLGYVDLDDLMASDDAGFQSNIIHLLAERFAVRNYARRIGMASVGAAWARAHPVGLRAEAQFFQGLFNDPSIHFNWERTAPNGAYTAGFRSRAERYHIFLMIRGGRGEIKGTVIRVRTRDGRRMSADDFLAEREAAAAAAP